VSLEDKSSTSKFMVIIGMITAVLLILYVPPTIDFSIVNPFWNGYTVISDRLNATIIDKPFTFPIKNPSETAIITISYSRYIDLEIENLKNFVKNGGTLIILDDYGYADQILRAFGDYVTIINNTMLVDSLFNYKNGRLPRIIEFSEDPDVANITEIIFNHASALYILSPKVKVLAFSSSFSFLDNNLNGIWDPGEQMGPFPVIAKFKYESGTVYVISDPSFLLNSMVDMGDNYKLILNLVKNKNVWIDQYHLKDNLHYQIRKYIVMIINWLSHPYVSPYITALFMMSILIMIVRVMYKRGV